MARAQDFLGEDRLLAARVNNAGTGVWDGFEKQDAATSQRDIDLNITALTTLCHAFLPLPRQHGQPACLLNIAWLAAFLPTPRFAVYSVTQSHVLRFSDILAYERRDSTISVICSCPGGRRKRPPAHGGGHPQKIKAPEGALT